MGDEIEGLVGELLESVALPTPELRNSFDPAGLKGN